MFKLHLIGIYKNNLFIRFIFASFIFPSYFHLATPTIIKKKHNSPLKNSFIRYLVVFESFANGGGSNSKIFAETIQAQ